MGAFYKYADKWRAAREDLPRSDDRFESYTYARAPPLRELFLPKITCELTASGVFNIFLG